jgi:hypothetical protein
VFETALSNYEAYGDCLRGLAAHRHSHTAHRIHQHCNRRFGHFAGTDPRGLGMGNGYDDTVMSFLERADSATLDVAAEIFGLPAASLPPQRSFRYVASHTFWRHGSEELGCLGGCGPCQSGRFACGLYYPFFTTQ